MRHHSPEPSVPCAGLGAFFEVFRPNSAANVIQWKIRTRFAAIVESVGQQKARMRDHLAELDALFASLQSRAFNGEL